MKKNKKTKDDSLTDLLALDEERLDRIIEKAADQFFKEQAAWLRPGRSYGDNENK